MEGFLKMILTVCLVLAGIGIFICPFLILREIQDARKEFSEQMKKMVALLNSKNVRGF